MSTLIETLTSYVPTLITQRLTADATPITTPTAERFSAAVLFADISGFTPLTERLAQQGPLGAETLTRELNTYFGQLVDLITAYGGDVVKFAGDALTALWKDEERNPFHPSPFLRAASCALAIQAALKDYQTADDLKLSLRIGLGAGDIAAIHVGGVYGRWEFVITGLPLSQVSHAESLARPGEVIVSPEAWDFIKASCTGHLLADDYVHLTAIEEDLIGIKGAKTSFEFPSAPTSSPTVSSEIETALRAYIPGAILARLAAGQSGWLAELRRVTILFINLPDLTYTTPLEQGQAAMQALQSALYRYEGSVNKISVDDKGATLVAALGLPPLAHEDDPARGVQAALAMQTALHKLGWRCAIGVTTGRAFCGSVGNATRREYTMMGDTVNLAARLMQAAGKDLRGLEDLGGLATPIFCDEATYQTARSHIAFEVLSPIKVKGKAQPIPIFRPLTGSPTSKSKIQNLKSKIIMVGRSAERMLLAEHLQKLQRGHSGLVIIEGEAGIGKSRLVANLLEQALVMGVPALLGAGDAIEKNTTYHAWQPIFRTILGLTEVNDAATAHQKILETLAALDPALTEQTPLLGAVLPFDFPDTSFTQTLAGKVRAEKTRALLGRILAGAAGGTKGPVSLLLVMEDAHWLDSASWALLQQVQQEIKPLLLIIATRPMLDGQGGQTSLPIEYQQLASDPATQYLKLTVLPAEDILTLVCQRLGVTELPPPVADLIQQKSEGHPFFSEELAYALRDTGLIEIEVGQCRLAPGAGDLHRLDFPDTLQGVITSRIDRLTPPQQLALKVASVIGRVFAFRLLRDVHPLDADKLYLPDYLHALAQLDLTPLESPEPELSYIFKHIITQEVAYNLMAFAQRHQLHQAVAEWYERTHTQDLSPFLPLLAYHWSQTAVTDKAVDYLLQAGDRARTLYAHQEAIDFYRQALAILKEQGQAEKAARTLMKLGQTYAAAFDFQHSQEAYQEGFKLWRQVDEAEREQVLSPAPHTLRLALAGEPMVIDPAQEMGNETYLIISQLFSGLVEYNPELDIIPAVAHSWEISVDGLRYVFHLRENVTWSDGTPVTAADFRFAWLRVLNPAIGSLKAEMLFDIKGAKALYRGEVTDPASVGIHLLDATTLVVELEQPTAYFLHLLAYTAFYPVPQHLLKAPTQAPKPSQSLVTNGPFRISTWQPGQTMSLSRNPTYYGKFTGNVQQVDLFFSRDWSVQRAKYQANTLDMLDLGSSHTPPLETDLIQQQFPEEYVSSPTLSTKYLGFDVRRPPFHDPRVRRAFAFALNREELIKVIFKDYVSSAPGGFVPPGMPGHLAGLGLPYNPKLARELLAEAGYPNGHNFPEVEWLIPGTGHTDKDYIQAQWQENLGIELTWELVDWPTTFYDRLAKHQPHLYFLTWYADYPDPDNFLRTSDFRWETGWHHAHYTELVERARGVMDPVERMRLYAQAEQILIEEVPIIPLVYGRRHQLIKPWVSRFPTSAIGQWFLKDVIIEPH